MLRSSFKYVLVILLLTFSSVAPAATPQTIYAFTGSVDGRFPNAGVVRTADGSLYGTTYYGGTSGFGTVYKISVAGDESVIHSFAGGKTDGASPAATLFVGQNGVLYGTTAYGGTGPCSTSQGVGCGTIFQMDTAGNFKILYSFQGGSDGVVPVSVIQATNGDLYGTTNGGGMYNSGTVFHLTLSGAENLLHTFNYNVDSGAPGQLIEGNDGNFYATTGYFFGGMFKITPAGMLTVLHTFKGGPSDAAFPTGSLTKDSAGNFYGTAPYGGNYGFGAIFSITPTGQETLVYSFTGGLDGSRPNSALLLEGGTLYGTTPAGGSGGYGTIFGVTTAGVETNLYTYPDCENDNTQLGVGIAMTDSGQTGVAYGVTSGGCPLASSDLNGSVYSIDLIVGAPTAVAGSNQTIAAGQTVYLNGSGSFAPDTTSASLGYAWSFVSTPSGSRATLSGATTATPSFLADQQGTYAVALVVTDPVSGLSSAPSRLIISSVWSPPTASAGSAQSSVVGVAVTLSGSGTDPNGLPLTFAWSLVSTPTGSAATLVGANTPTASFTPDMLGSYTAGLVVSDQFGGSPQSTVTVSVVTASDYAQQQIGNAISYMASLPDASLDAPGHRNAFTNLLDQAITAIQGGDFSNAAQKLASAITRTDGCSLRGAADGPGPSMDWITNCAAETVLYTDLTNALNILP